MCLNWGICKTKQNTRAEFPTLYISRYTLR